MSEADPTSGLPPHILDQLRRSVPLRMNAMGGLSLGGEAVTHQRVDQALRGGLDLSDQGEVTVRIGTHWCYLTVDDCPLRTTAVAQGEAGALRLRLDDGRQLALDPSTLWEEPGRGLRCTAPARVSGRPLPVRFTNRAQMDLSPWLRIAPDGTASLTTPGGSWPIGSEPPAADSR